MEKLELPMELVSLVHYIELNKAGWWDVAAQRLILAAMWIAGRPLTLDQIIDEARESLHLRLERAKAEALVTHLRQAGVVLALSDDRLKISEQSCRDFEKEVGEAEAVQCRARDKFMDIVDRLCPDLEPEEAWRAVNEELFLPTVREMGCRFYNLIADEDVEIGEIPSFQNFLDQYPPDVSIQLQEAIPCYLFSGDIDVRSYILRYLSAYFFLEAGNLSDQTIQALAKSMDKLLSFRIFVDTNFIFSVLGVHANPSDEAAQTALALTKRLSDRISVQLYVVPPTVEETKQAIQWRLDKLGNLRLTPNMARASLRQPELTGFIRRLAEEAERLGEPLMVKDYFGPYVTNLIQILRAKGLELYNADLREYRTNQLVIDDVTSQMEYEQRTYGEGAKTYEKMLHDMVLWHFVRAQRPAVIESPLEAESWIVTVDYRFLGFDAFKGRTLHEEIPVCLHPAALIQLLQFWVPRTAELEETLYSSWVWPLLFQEFDPKAEEVTIRILRALSRFENIGDLPSAILDRILVNQALRQKMSAEDEVAEQIEILRDALVKEARRATEESEVQRHRAEEAEREVAVVSLQVKSQQEAIEAQTRELGETRDLLRQSDKARESLQSRLAELEVVFGRIKFVALWVLVPVAATLLIGAGVASAASNYWGWEFWRTAGFAWASFLIPAIWLIDKKGLCNPRVCNSRAFQLFHRFKRWLFGFLGAVIVGIIVELIIKWIPP
ncbi:MAG: hypothetical protein U9R11_05930 [Chloroflexota bacterium]|nr:hypothetical protein [Chloroflexota bacterium]